MPRVTASSPNEIAHYEGLIHATAARYERSIEADFDDIVAILRIKVWRALEAYDPARSTLPVRRYVFACVTNQCKDLLKKRRRGELSLDGLGEEAPAFEQRYLSVSAEVAFLQVERETVTLPSTLTAEERQVVLLLYQGYKVAEITVRLGHRRPAVRALIESVQLKMADWRPTAVEPSPELVAA